MAGEVKTWRYGDVKVWRYSIPPINGQGWGIFLLDSTGMFAAVTDYGNCAFKWSHHGCKDFREFIAKIKPEKHNEYYIKKLFGGKDTFDGERTVKEIKRHILETRHMGDYSKEFARKEWELVEYYSDMCDVGFYNWCEQTNISDAHEFSNYDYSLNLKLFGSELLPRLAVLLREELNLANKNDDELQ